MTQTFRSALGTTLAVGLAAGVAHAQEAQDPACSLPGLLVVEDASGDSLGGVGFGDIQSLHIAEPAEQPGKLVFTYKVADLAVLPPSQVWIIRFLTDVLPAEGQEYFIALLTSPDGSPHFVQGTGAPIETPAAAPLLFTPSGPLDAHSGFNADGTITLVLDRATVPGLNPGQIVFGMTPLAHRITPTDGTQPFAYGFRSVSSSVIAWDDTFAPDEYTVLGTEGCSAEDKGLLGVAAGAFPSVALILFGLALRRVRRLI